MTGVPFHKGREGKGREGKGREGQGRGGNGRGGKGRGGKGRGGRGGKGGKGGKGPMKTPFEQVRKAPSGASHMCTSHLFPGANGLTTPGSAFFTCTFFGRSSHSVAATGSMHLLLAGQPGVAHAAQQLTAMAEHLSRGVSCNPNDHHVEARLSQGHNKMPCPTTKCPLGVAIKCKVLQCMGESR